MSAACITVALSRPVIVDGTPHVALQLRPLKPRDLKKARGGFDGEVGIVLAARLANVPVAAILALPDADAERVGTVVHRMLDRVL